MDALGATPHDDLPAQWPTGWHVAVVDETGSTNADLIASALRGAPDRSVLAARHQPAGRGRLDRRWAAPAGANLLVSLLFTRVPPVPHVLTQRVAIAAAVASERLAGVRPTLKWPNDLLLDGAKLAGVLAQATIVPAVAATTASEPPLQVVVVGIGVNVGWAPPDAARLGDSVRPMQLLAALLHAYDELPDDIIDDYRARLGTLGRQVRVELPDGSVVEGRALDVEVDGRLVVLDECGITHRFQVGDIVHLR